VADYVILDSAKDKDFASLLNSTNAANKVAMRASFVHDCVEQCALLVPTVYLFEPAPQKRKRGRLSMATPSPAMEGAQKKKKKITGKPVGEKTRIDDDPTPNAGIQSPSPLRNDTGALSSGGRNLFSDKEKAYFMRYARILLERDPLVSGNSMAQKMHKKVDFIEYFLLVSAANYLTSVDAHPLSCILALLHS
jgi:hypothetical protein